MSVEKWIVDGPKVIDLELVRSVKVTLIGGKVDILTHDEPTARVEVHSVSGLDLKISIDGDALEVDHPQLRWDNFIDVFSSFAGRAKADVSVLIPRDASLTLGVISATALISGITSNAKLNTVSGELIIDGSVGSLEVKSVTGEVSLSGHVGALAVRTVSGDITASGAITKFAADGVSADVIVDSSAAPDGISNNTVSGALTVRLPENSAAKYVLNTVSGAIQLDDVHITGTRGRGYEERSGDPDGHVVELRANSVSGDIAVIRTGPARTSAEENTETVG